MVRGWGRSKLERKKAPGRKYIQQVWRTDDVAWTRAAAVRGRDEYEKQEMFKR